MVTRVLCLLSGWGLLATVMLAAPAVAQKHPVFDPGVAAGDRGSLEQSLRPLLDVTEAELALLVPERNGLVFCGCPHCDGGTQDGQMTWRGWQDPDKVQCRFCEMIFPNDEYAEDQELAVLNPRGQRVVYRYHRDEKEVYFFSARARYSRKFALAEVALRMAKLAYLTGDAVHQRKAVVLLDAFGQRYPGWCVMSDRAFREDGPLDSYPEKPHPYYGGVWSRWYYDDIPRRLILAYDLVYDSDQWRRLSEEKGLDVRKRLEDEVFRAAVAFVRGYEERMSNKAPNIYRGLIVAGRVLEEPDYVHDAVDRFRRFVRSQFFFDGVWREGSVSYHRQTLQGLQQLIDLTAGYSDPEGYEGAQGEGRFDRLDLAAESPFLQKVTRAPSALLFPNRRAVPVHDAWAREELKPLEPPQTKLLAAAEHCCLHRGQGADQMQARLHFSPGYGHKHRDLLSLILWAGGRELLSDIGYTHTAYRKAWTQSAAAHNTVVVDESEQETRGDRCELALFDTAPGLLQTVEATGPGVYPGVTSMYRRQLILVDVSPGSAYVVDLFRVAGGRRHDWFLHGSAGYDQSVAADIELRKTPGVLLGPNVPFRLPVNERDDGDAGDRNIAYAFIGDLAQRQTDGPWTATFRFEPDSSIRLRTTVLGQLGTTVVCGRCPSVRRAAEDDSKLREFTMPVIVARREGDDLSSLFAAVHEPFRDRPTIRGVRRLDSDSGAEATVVLEIDRGSERDVVLCAVEERAEQVVAVPGDPTIEFAGRTGFVRFRGKEMLAAYLLDGTLLRCADAELTLPPAPAGAITGVLREDERFGFRVNERLPANSQLAGRTVLVELPDGARHGYRIERTQPAADGGSTIVLADDPGFAMGDDAEIDFLYFPQRKLSGPCRYRILTTARWRPTRGRGQ